MIREIGSTELTLEKIPFFFLKKKRKIDGPVLIISIPLLAAQAAVPAAECGYSINYALFDCNMLLSSFRTKTSLIDRPSRKFNSKYATYIKGNRVL